ncbi:Taurine catabolism dioxygenase TauD, TfdA family [Maricaulis salignorans]|uniref:Taurine catabolism dioxygenase TauD, TfdA family n=2 Tax=Maricaulis salignorans TaxID=144026 RepID=A0A1G9UAA1_9PROT|nr:Taurine catabolism dioxygenase TauD, TfdA family [Maricaulis salignorans]
MPRSWGKSSTTLKGSGKPLSSDIAAHPAMKLKGSLSDQERPMSELAKKLEISGYALLTRYRPEADILAVVHEIGVPIEPWEGGLVQLLKPRKDGTPNTYSGNFGLEQFPFHSDLAHWLRPPRYILLRCQVGFEDTPTLLLDGRNLIQRISRPTLSRTVYRPRRPRAGAHTLLRLLETEIDGEELLRWDELFLQPTNRFATDTGHTIGNFIKSYRPLAVALSRPGDILIIDNWRMLHARSPIVAGREGRIIQRVYLGELN